MQKIKKLGIFFGDNDFSTVIENIMWGLGYSGCTYTKSQIVQLFNAMAGPMYWANKGYCERHDEQTFPQYPYLTISESNVYLDDEVDQLIVDRGKNMNCEFNYIDFGSHDDPVMYNL